MKPSRKHVLAACSLASGVSFKDLCSESRLADIVNARCAFYIIGKRDYAYSLASLSKIVRRDHTTAVFSLKHSDQPRRPGVIEILECARDLLKVENRARLTREIPEEWPEPANTRQRPGPSDIGRIWIGGWHGATLQAHPAPECPSKRVLAFTCTRGVCKPAIELPILSNLEASSKLASRRDGALRYHDVSTGSDICRGDGRDEPAKYGLVLRRRGRRPPIRTEDPREIPALSAF